MSYTMQRPLQGLGYDLIIGTPLGDQKITLPLEQMTKDLTKTAIDAAWPDVQNKINGMMPGLLATAEQQAVTVILPKVMPKVEAEVNKVVNNTVTSLTPAAVGAVGLLVASTWFAAWWVRKRR